MSKIFAQFKDNVSATISKLEVEFSEIVSSIEKIKDEQKLELDKYNSVKDLVDSLKKEEVKINSDLNKRMLDVIAREEQIKLAEEKSTKKLNEEKVMVFQLVQTRDDVSEDLERLKQETKNLKPLQTLKETLESTIADLSKKEQDARDKFNSLVKSGEEELLKLLKRNKEAEQEFAKIKEENAKEFGVLKPRIEALNKKEEELSEKEKALSVVESRYRKLFSDQGISFKI